MQLFSVMRILKTTTGRPKRRLGAEGVMGPSARRTLDKVPPAFTDDQVDAAIAFVIADRAIDRAQTVRYTAVFEAAGLQPPQELHLGGDSDVVTAFMKAFHDRCRVRGLPPLDALVVHVAGGREGRPGGGYFKVNGHVDPFAERSNASADEVLAAHTFWESQIAEVRSWGVQRRRGRR